MNWSCFYFNSLRIGNIFNYERIKNEKQTKFQKEIGILFYILYIYGLRI